MSDAAAGDSSLVGQLEEKGRELERLTRELAARETYLRAIIDTEPECVKVVDVEGRLVDINPAGLAMLEVDSLAEAQQGPLVDFVLPEYRELFAAVHRAVMAGEARTLEFEVRGRRGTRRWLETHATPLRRPDGTVQALVGVTRDISRRKAAEQTLREREEQLRQAQKMESVGRLAAGIAHDFNNLLTVIGGTAELALGDLPEGTQLRDDLIAIRVAAARASELTRQLLAYSRKQVLRPETIDLGALLHEAEVLLTRVLGVDIRVVVTGTANLAPVRVDPGQFHQVILNLAVNSRDAMPEGGTITIAARNVEVVDGFHDLRPGRYVLVSVSDTGVGMDAATMQRIFEPFFTTKESGKGTGLGLATVHGIVKQSGGEIHVSSEPGKGTTVTFYLPVALPGDAAQTGAAAPSDSRAAQCLLVVDDDVSVLTLTRRVLERAGYSVLSAANGPEALRLLERYRGPVDLLLADVVMPGMTGVELSHHLRELRPDVRVLFMSGYTEDPLVRRGVVDRGIELISKPYSPGDLMRKVKETLAARSS